MLWLKEGGARAWLVGPDMDQRRRGYLQRNVHVHRHERESGSIVKGAWLLHILQQHIRRYSSHFL